MADPSSSDHEVAAAVAQAGRLRQAALVIRRNAGHLTYHPATGQRPRPSPDLLRALDEVNEVVTGVQRGAEVRAMEEVAAASSTDHQAEQLRRSHAAVDQGVQVVLAALEVLRGVLGNPDGASVDAPYGRGAPQRHHPGALCTMVAERVEGLAQAIEVAAIVKANLDRRPRPAAANRH